jgi:RND family efflux transporter MFP subunit
MSKVARILLPVLVLAGGGAGAGVLLAARQEAPRKARPPVVTPVEVTDAPPADGPVVVRAQGTLVPAREVALQAEIAGRVTHVDAALAPGGRVASGTELMRIDERDYRLAIEQQRAEVEKARFELEMEQGRKSVAHREWKLLGDDAPHDDKGKSLALREPQIRNARAGVKAAESGLEQARISLERTRLRAPFNAVVRTEGVEVGQVVRPGQTVATLVGTDQWWVQVSLPADELGWLEVPGARATLLQDLGGGHTASRTGRVVRLMSDVDPVGLMARVLVEVDDPLGLKNPGLTPLLLGSVVDVTLDGRDIADVREIPRRALREGDTVWTAREVKLEGAAPALRAAFAGRDAGQVLDVRKVRVVRRERDRVLVRAEDLPADAKVIVSRLAAPVPGIALAASVATAVRGVEARAEARRAGEVSPEQQ